MEDFFEVQKCLAKSWKFTRRRCNNIRKFRKWNWFWRHLETRFNQIKLNWYVWSCE